MNLSALLTSAGINTGVCVVVFLLYSVLRKQQRFRNVYFGQKLSQVKLKRQDRFSLERFVPSAGWMFKAWEASHDEVYACGGLDGLVFLRVIIFSIRIFSVSAIICVFLVLPANYYGNSMQHKQIPGESLEVFSIDNVEIGSRWLWTHCVALYTISCFACILLYHEYKNFTKMRLSYIHSSLSSPRLFTVLVRAIPWSPDESYSETVGKFFTKYYSSSYLSHQMVYQSGALHKLMTDAGKMCQLVKSTAREQHSGQGFLSCLFGGKSTSFKACGNEQGRDVFDGSYLRKKECAAALVFFRTRYAAFVCSQTLQSPNPVTWVTDKAPDPADVYWTNLTVPYRIFWIRRIAILVVSLLFVIFFLVPVALTQSLVNLDKLHTTFPFLKGILKRHLMSQLVTGYLPSVILMLFLYIAPPVMYFFSTMEGAISRSARKHSACVKLLYFMIWNVFFANILSGAIIKNFVDVVAQRLSNPKDIPNRLAAAIPTSATFFMAYVLTSGWASLACELLQPIGVLCNLFYRYILRNKDESTYGTYSFPYHTEIPRLALFGLIGFTCSIMAPLILPLLLVYFFMAYLVYRNQILNVYVMKYQTGGLYWPVMHNAIMFSLVLTQVIALGTFGLKRSTVASSFTFPLIMLTLLFHQYCRKKFFPIFRNDAAQVIIDMDQDDEKSGKMAEIHRKLPYEYCQFTEEGLHKSESTPDTNIENGGVVCPEELDSISPGLIHFDSDHKSCVAVAGVDENTLSEVCPSKLQIENSNGEHSDCC